MAGLTHHDRCHSDLAVEHPGDLLRGTALDQASAELVVTPAGFN
jgi:hypothetical protein